MPAVRRLAKRGISTETYVDPRYNFPVFSPESLVNEFTQQVDQRIAGLTPSSTTLALSTGWMKDVDTSAFGDGKSTALITPQHSIGVAHEFSAVGATVHWTGASKIPYSRTVTAATGMPGQDVVVLTFDSPLPSDITPFSILHPYAFGWMPSLGRISPAIFISQNTRQASLIFVESWPVSVTFSSPGQAAFATVIFGDSDPRQVWNSWYVSPTGGDSGSPMCVIFKNRVLLMSVVSLSDNSGVYVPQAIDWINSVVSPYELSVITPDDFPKYAAYA